ncbi:unnamed protein product [Cochlearia groenlandica]
MKYVVVTGGVVSGLGKGVTASSIALLLKSCGLRLTSLKIDPYLNTDAGTMSPFEHGEVFVLEDGGEVDLDLGNYERFLDIKLTRDHNITTGKIYQHVIAKERKGDYLGKTVQVVPHITDAIQEWIERVAVIPVDGEDGPADICVIELGGTIGDIESAPFIEALGQFSYRVGPGNFCLVHVSLVPVLNVVGEQKTKPTQHSVRGLRGLGLTPDILACRSTKALEDNVKEKLAQFCHVPLKSIFTLYDVPNIWHIPLLLKDQKAHLAISKVLNLASVVKEPSLEEWTSRADLCDNLHVTVRIAIVGKYTGLSDAYLSVLKALLHASVACRKKLIVDWVPACDLEKETEKENPNAYKAAWKLIKGVDGVLVPGGFGDRGLEGKILAAKYARENRIPFLGICLGMQIAVIEFARSVLGLHDANSTEFKPETKHPCIIFMPEGSKTMRLGSRKSFFHVKDSKPAKLYGNKSFVDERHRHGYEVNPDMVERLEKAGLSFAAKDESGKCMEIIELPNHPFFIGAQFHPEFKSRPGKASPLFLGLIAASCGELEKVLNPTSVHHHQHHMISSNGPKNVLVNGTSKKTHSGLADVLSPRSSIQSRACPRMRAMVGFIALRTMFIQGGPIAFGELELAGKIIKCPHCHVPFIPHLGHLIAAKFQCESCGGNISYRNSTGTRVMCPCCDFTRPMPTLKTLICGGCEVTIIHQSNELFVRCSVCQHSQRNLVVISPEQEANENDSDSDSITTSSFANGSSSNEESSSKNGKPESLTVESAADLASQSVKKVKREAEEDKNEAQSKKKIRPSD